MKLDVREARIVMQNALANATKIAIHNSKGESVSVDEVVALAKKIALEVVKIGSTGENK